MGFEFIRSGTDARKKLDALEQKLSSLQEEIRLVGAAPVPLDELRRRLKTAIENRLYTYAPENAFGAFQTATMSYAELPQSMGFEHLAYLFGVDEIVDRVMNRLKFRAPNVGLPLAERPKKLNELQLALRQAEREIELETLRLEKAGYAILRQADADPEVLLEVWAKAEA